MFQKIPEDEFYGQPCKGCQTLVTPENIAGRGKHRKRHWCKTCQYARNKVIYKQNRLRTIEYLGGCCNRCGYTKCKAALHCHHIDESTKHPSWTSMRYWNWKRLKEELAKCELLCANCHAEEHYGDSFDGYELD